MEAITDCGHQFRRLGKGSFQISKERAAFLSVFL